MMNPQLNDVELVRSLRSALPRIDAARPSHDLWPTVRQRTGQSAPWSAADWGAAAVIVITLLLFPQWFWFFAYHL